MDDTEGELAVPEANGQARVTGTRGAHGVMM